MDTFVWDERYQTGEAQIDSEHQRLVELINSLIEMQTTEEHPPEAPRVLAELVAYAAEHFAHEEALMALVGCDPRFSALHLAQHRQFVEQVGQMKEKTGGGPDYQGLLSFLTPWLAVHILGTDKSTVRQINRIRAGMTPEEAYRMEDDQVTDPAMASMLKAMGSLFRLVASRNDALNLMNRGLEEMVETRTRELSDANGQLRVERDKLQLTMNQLDLTQKKLLASEHQRATEAKRHMQRFLSQIIDGDPVPTLVIDAEHRITHWNRACATLSGLATETMVGTQDHWRAFYPAYRPIMADLIVDGSLEEHFEAYYQDNFRRSSTIEGAFEAEGFFPLFGEGGRWLFFTAAPLRDHQGKIIGAIETLQDVTKRHQAEDELLVYQSHLEELVLARTQELAETNVRLASEQAELQNLLSKIDEAQAQLLQSEKMAAIGQLAAGVAHEINNPIGFVNSNLGTLKSYIANLFEVIEAYEKMEISGDQSLLKAARQRADLEFLRDDLPSLLAESQDGLSRVTRIVQDLKDFSRVDQAERQLADLNAAMESTLNVVRNEIKYKADVVLELADLPQVDCVPAQINQVFMNLLVNAAQAIPQRGKIFVRSGLENGHVWFEVEDTGKGMSEETRRRIFEPFFTTKPVGQGTGLGLSISYDIIVKKHGGRFDVRSEEDKGTCFRLWLPLSMPESDQVA